MISLARSSLAAVWWPYYDQELIAVVESFMSKNGLQNVDLELCLVGDEEITPLNKQFMGCPGPTNVLSFPSQNIGAYASKSGAKGTDLGSIIVSVETAGREANLYGQNMTKYCLRLICHALLHLAGYEHGEEMEAKTEKTLACCAQL